MFTASTLLNNSFRPLVDNFSHNEIWNVGAFSFILCASALILFMEEFQCCTLLDCNALSPVV